MSRIKSQSRVLAFRHPHTVTHLAEYRAMIPAFLKMYSQSIWFPMKCPAGSRFPREGSSAFLPVVKKPRNPANNGFPRKIGVEANQNSQYTHPWW